MQRNTMKGFSTITKKGQVTIPKVFREKLGLKHFTKIALDLDENEGVVKIRASKDILDMAGEFEIEDRRSILKAREALETSYKRS